MAEITLCHAVLDNRKRVADVMFFELEDYAMQKNNELMQKSQTEFINSLSQSEKLMVQNYTNINSMGKGYRSVAILILYDKLKYYELIYKIRTNERYSDWFVDKSPYFFAYPESIRWIDGSTAI